MCFSVNPAMISSPSGRRLLAAVPKERILVETDGPYVRHGGRPVSPADAPSVVAALAGRWGMTTTEGAALVGQTLIQLIAKAEMAGAA